MKSCDSESKTLDKDWDRDPWDENMRIRIKGYTCYYFYIAIILNLSIYCGFFPILIKFLKIHDFSELFVADEEKNPKN